MTDFDVGTTVTLTAAPESESSFAGWSGGGCSGTGTCVVTLSAATQIDATFTRVAEHTLSVSKDGTGLGTVTSSPGQIDCGETCAESFADETLVTLVAEPDSGSTFAGWSGAGCAGTDACVVTMSAARSVTATFECSVGTVTFEYTGAVQHLEIPSCVSSVDIVAYGAAGGASPSQNSVGGLGGSASGTLAVSGGQTLYVAVGKRGNDSSGGNDGVPGVFGGGGAGGSSIGGEGQPGGASGGGASDVRVGGQALSDRVIVAAGGGGAGGGTVGTATHGGAGGGATGGLGTSYASGLGHEAMGGTQLGGGSAGTYQYADMVGGTDGGLGTGGNGWGGGYSGGGGGGGGYFGGGGGSCHFESGGGGGSSYVGGVTGGTTAAGVRNGDGMVTISW